MLEFNIEPRLTNQKAGKRRTSLFSASFQIFGGDLSPAHQRQRQPRWVDCRQKIGRSASVGGASVALAQSDSRVQHLLPPSSRPMGSLWSALSPVAMRPLFACDVLQPGTTGPQRYCWQLGLCWRASIGHECSLAQCVTRTSPAITTRDAPGHRAGHLARFKSDIFRRADTIPSAAESPIGGGNLPLASTYERKDLGTSSADGEQIRIRVA